MCIVHCLLGMHTLICVTFSLPPGVRGWLRLLLVALFGLFCLPFYTSINFMSKNFGTIFLPPIPKMCNNVDKAGTIRNKLIFWWILTMCKLRRITHTLHKKPSGFTHKGLTQCVSDSPEFTHR